MALDDEEGAEAILVERSRAWWIATVIATVGSFAGLLAFGSRDLGTLLSVGWLALTVTAVVGFGWALFQNARRTPARIRIVPNGCRVTTERGVKTLERGKFWTGSTFTAVGGRHVVELVTWRGGAVRLDVGGAAEARRVLAAVGLDRRGGTSRFVVRRTSPATRALSGAGGGVALTITSFLLLLASPAAMLALWALAALVSILAWSRTRTTLTVGTDGIELKPLLGRRLFIPHQQITRVMEMLPPAGELVSHGFVLHRSASQELVEIDTRGERFRGGVWATDPVRDAINNAWAGAQNTGSAKAAFHQLANEQGSTREWIGKLRAYGAGEQRADYRAPALDERALFDVVSDATADPDLRAAAAVTLGANQEHAPRLRVVADDIADDRIRRVALAATDPEGDEALEAELEPLVRRRMTRG